MRLWSAAMHVHRPGQDRDGPHQQPERRATRSMFLLKPSLKVFWSSCPPSLLPSTSLVLVMAYWCVSMSPLVVSGSVVVLSVVCVSRSRACSGVENGLHRRFRLCPPGMAEVPAGWRGRRRVRFVAAGCRCVRVIIVVGPSFVCWFVFEVVSLERVPPCHAYVAQLVSHPFDVRVLFRRGPWHHGLPLVIIALSCCTGPYPVCRRVEPAGGIALGSCRSPTPGLSSCPSTKTRLYHRTRRPRRRSGSWVLWRPARSQQRIFRRSRCVASGVACVRGGASPTRSRRRACGPR